MYVKIDRKRKVRYPGTDVAEWKVITPSGAEYSRYELRRVAGASMPQRRLVRRWNGFATANAAASSCGGTAVRA